MPKNDYSVIAFFPDKSAKKWNYVHKLNGFINFLDLKFPLWDYVNVYDRRTRDYIKRIRKGESA